MTIKRHLTARVGGLSPIEWVLVAALLLILGATAWPRFASSSIERQHRAARHSLQTFALAQRQVRTLGGSYATPRELCGKDPYLGQVTGPNMLGSPWHRLIPGDDQGQLFHRSYRIAFFMDEERQHWVAVAWPEIWGCDGRAVFLLTQQGRIWQNEKAEEVEEINRATELLEQAFGSLERALSAENVHPRGRGWE